MAAGVASGRSYGWRSVHCWVAFAVAAAAIGWGIAQGARFGSRDPDQVVYLLTTGWVATAAFAFLAFYAARKAAHRSGWSPEFKRRLPLAQLEKVQSALQGLENEARGAALLTVKAAKRRATLILKEHGASRVLRVRVDNTPDGVRVTALPANAIGRLSSWLAAHVWWGVAAAILVFCHGGGRTGSTMGLWLNVLSALVIGSGIVGILLWTWGPRWLTRQERELSVEQALAYDEHYARRLREAAQAWADGDGGGGAIDADLRRTLEAGDLLSTSQLTALMAAAPAEVQILAQQRQRVGAEWRRLRAARGRITTWRIVHVPLSIALLALVVVHIWGVCSY